MADWNKPVATDSYLDVLTLIKNRDFDAASLFLSAPTNPITGMIRYNRTTKIFEEYDGSAWIAKLLEVAGGGTGAANAADARTNLGLGTMATQANNAVNITGGTITGLTTLTLSSLLGFTADNTYDIGTATVRPRYGFFRSGFALPVGADKWIPA